MRDTIGGYPAKQWHWTILTARTHEFMGWLAMFYMWFMTYCLTYCILDRSLTRSLIAAVFLCLTVFVQFTGIHAIWLCKKNNIDWNKNWYEQ